MVITPATLLYVAENVKYLHSQGFNQIYSRFSLMTDWKNVIWKGVLSPNVEFGSVLFG